MRPGWLILTATLLTTAALTGCLGDDTTPAPSEELGSAGLLDEGTPTHVRTVQVDDRWSGEPSILALDDGTLLITGAGGFTRYVEDPTDAPGDFGQSYIWRSTDDGATWTFVDHDLGLPHPADALTPYRNAMPGVEGDLAQGPDGRVYFVDLAMLASNALSVSEDSGQTWLATQNPIAGLPGTDRPWVEAAENGEVYVKYLQTTTGYRIARSTDGGQTFLEDTAMPGCSQADLVIDREAATLVIPCVDGEELSILRTPTGQTPTFERVDVPDADGPASNVFTSLAVAGEGHYAYLYSETVDGTARVRVTTSIDAGLTWSQPTTLSAPNTTAVFPWISANANGTVGAVFYEANGTSPPNEADGAAWYPVHASFRLTADGSTAPMAERTVLTSAPIHEGAICTGGLGCVLDGRSEDRRLLDFFEVDVDAAGTSHVTWTDTTTDVPTIWYGQVA